MEPCYRLKKNLTKRLGKLCNFLLSNGRLHNLNYPVIFEAHTTPVAHLTFILLLRYHSKRCPLTTHDGQLIPNRKFKSV